MIVVITSLAPVIARSAPEIPAHAAPAMVASSMHSTTWMPCGIPSQDEPDQTATIEPTMYWPWPPMLNSPARNA